MDFNEVLVEEKREEYLSRKFQDTILVTKSTESATEHFWYFWYCAVIVENCWYLLKILMKLLIIASGTAVYWYLSTLLMWVLIIFDIYWDLLFSLTFDNNAR